MVKKQTTNARVTIPSRPPGHRWRSAPGYEAKLDHIAANLGTLKSLQQENANQRARVVEYQNENRKLKEDFVESQKNCRECLEVATLALDHNKAMTPIHDRSRITTGILGMMLGILLFQIMDLLAISAWVRACVIIILFVVGTKLFMDQMRDLGNIRKMVEAHKKKEA